MKGELVLSKCFRESLESRRQELINKLITYNVYKIDQKHLFELSLPQLEGAYKKFQADIECHQNGGSESIQGIQDQN